MKEKFIQKLSIGIVCFIVAVISTLGFISSCLKGNIGMLKAVVFSFVCGVSLAVMGIILFGDAYNLMSEDSRKHAETIKMQPIFGQTHHFKIWSEEEEAVMS